MFSGLQWDFPFAEMAGYIPEHMAMIMPLIIIIIGVLLALVVIEGVTDVMLRVVGFVAGVHTSGIEVQTGRKNSDTSLGVDDDREFS